jgi:NSS family neurotransmitter:Na+ symporter
MTAAAGDTRENWTSRFAFLMASIGFAVGLGNIWRFPYIVGENGGSAFIFVYLVFAIGIGVPMVMAEWTIGRRSSGAASASGSILAVAREAGVSSRWSGVGTMAVIAAFMLLMFYTVIAGWTMDYFVLAARGHFDAIDAAGSEALFDGLLGSPARLAFWHTVVVLLTVYTNARGITGGIENAWNLLMPALFLFVVVMVGYAWSVGDMPATVHFLLTPDFSRITLTTMLVALGQAFFSIGIAMTHAGHPSPPRRRRHRRHLRHGLRMAPPRGPSRRGAVPAHLGPDALRARRRLSRRLRDVGLLAARAVLP